MSKFKLDELDHQILEALIENARTPFTDIAKNLLVSAGTIHVRVKKMEDEGIMLPVISLSLNYKKSARYDDEIYVKTKLIKTPTATIEFDFEILNKEGEIITFANVILAFINMKTMRPTRCPKYILDKLQD